MHGALSWCPAKGAGRTASTSSSLEIPLFDPTYCHRRLCTLEDVNTHRRRDASRPSRKASKPIRQAVDKTLAIERSYTPDREAMLAALRVVLGLPKTPPQWLEELGR